MSDTQNPAGKGLPTLSADAIQMQAFEMLLAEAGIDDSVRKAAAYANQAKYLCPGLVVAAAHATHHSNPALEPMARQMLEWRDQLARQSLDRLHPEDRNTAIESLRQQYGETSMERTRQIAADTVRMALQTVGAVDGHECHTRIVPHSVLFLYKDLQRTTGMPHPHTLGNKDETPLALTLAELIRHCALITGATAGEQADIFHALAEAIVGPGKHMEKGPQRAIADHCEREKVEHEQAVGYLQECAKLWP